MSGRATAALPVACSLKSHAMPQSPRPRVQMPIHLRPTAALAERVLLPGDPGRALTLAQSLLSEPRMFNHHRGLWGYTGSARDGQPLTIQATGMGGPSAAIVLCELIALGASRAIRVGTCGALSDDLALGDLVVARAALCLDGASRALGCDERVPADGALTRALLACAPGAHAGTVASVDLFYGGGDHAGGAATAAADGAIAVEMEAAALFAVGAASDVAVGCVLAVSDTFDAAGARTRIDDHTLLAAAERMGAAALEAMSD
jgi:uridine phosphorylase